MDPILITGIIRLLGLLLVLGSCVRHLPRRMYWLVIVGLILIQSTYEAPQ